MYFSAVGQTPHFSRYGMVPSSNQVLFFNHPHRSQTGSEWTIEMWYHQSPLGTDPSTDFSTIHRTSQFVKNGIVPSSNRVRCWISIFNHPHKSHRGSANTTGMWYHQSPLGTYPFMYYSKICWMSHFGREMPKTVKSSMWRAVPPSHSEIRSSPLN